MKYIFRYSLLFGHKNAIKQVRNQQNSHPVFINRLFELGCCCVVLIRLQRSISPGVTDHQHEPNTDRHLVVTPRKLSGLFLTSHCLMLVGNT